MAGSVANRRGRGVQESCQFYPARVHLTHEQVTFIGSTLFTQLPNITHLFKTN